MSVMAVTRLANDLFQVKVADDLKFPGAGKMDPTAQGPIVLSECSLECSPRVLSAPP